MLLSSIFASDNQLSELANLVAWWDASDSSTITHSSGSVSQITDKSGNGHTLTQGTSTAQPKINTETLNGLPVLDFDGGDNLSASTGIIGKNTTGITMYIVMRHDTTGTQISFSAETGSGGNRRLETNQYVDKFWFVHRVTDGGSEYQLSSERNPYNSYQVYSYRVDTSTAATRQFWGQRREVDGSSAGGTTSNTNNGEIQMGTAVWISSFPFNGQIAEVLIYHAAHSDSTMDLVNNYLRKKWGLFPKADGHITWYDPVAVGSDLSSLDTQSNQTLEYGWVFTGTTGTVGGITFTTASCDDETADATGLGFTHSNSTFASLLSTCEYKFTGNAVKMQLTLTGLTSGVMYEVQMFQIDTRTSSSVNTRLGFFSDDYGNDSKAFLHGDAVYVKGRFVATGTTQKVFCCCNNGPSGAQAAAALNMVILRRFN